MDLFSPWLAILAHSVSWSFLRKDKKAQRIEQRAEKKLLIFAKRRCQLYDQKNFSIGSNQLGSFDANKCKFGWTQVSRETTCFVLLSLSFFSPVDILKLVDLAGPETFNTTTSEPKWNPSRSGNIGKYMGGNNTPFDHLTAHNKTILFCFCYLSQNCTKCSLQDKIANSKRKSCDVMVFHYSREESSSWVLEILQYKFNVVGRLCIQNLYWGLTKELKAFLHFSNLLL